ncbi:hypothetical protein BGW39_004285 [Mortierella sp. 14UC]|nr:hypothetical protein BGW39_004285 [Mortierella sp. 14UC]
MKLSALCIISLGLSLAVFGSDAARAKGHHHNNRHVDQHHHQTPKDHGHHDEHVNDHHHHNNRAAEDHSYHKRQAGHKKDKKQQADHSHHNKHQADHSCCNKHVDHSHHMKANAIPSKPYKGSHRHDAKEQKKEPARDISQDQSNRALEDYKKPADTFIAAPAAPPRQEQPAIVASAPLVNRKEKMVVAY